MSSDSPTPISPEPPENPSLRLVAADTPADNQVAPAPMVIDSLLRCLLRATLTFDRPVTEADVRAMVPIGPDGMTPDVFIRAADRIGYRAGRTVLNAETARQLPAPFVIVGAEGSPARLVISREDVGFVVFDPIDGALKTMTPEEAIDGRREAIMISPKNAIAARADWRTLIRNRLRKVVWELILSSLVVNIFALAAPLFSMTVYNKVLGQKALDTLDVLVIGMVTLYIFDFILRAIRGYVSSHTGARLDALLGNEVLHRLLRLPFRHFETTPTGVISERLRQLDTVRSFFTGQMPIVLVDVCFMFVFLAALMFVSPSLGWITMGAIPLFLLISITFHRAQKSLVDRSFAALAGKTSALAETIANALTIKSLGLESEIEKKWGGRLALTAHTGFEASNMGNVVGVLGTILQQGVSLLIMYVGAREIIAGELSIGALIAANILSSRALAPVRQVVSAVHQLEEVKAAFGRIDEIMTEPIEAEPGATSPIPALKGDIEFENVSFSYGENMPPALENVTLKIPSGSIVGVIGPSGSGKSTIGRLIQALYTPTEGRVLIDRTDIAHMSPPWLRSQIGSVPQDVQLFAGSVRENIAMGMPVKLPERIVAVSKFVGAHDFIQRLPQGYDTTLTERGGGLSAGQRQLLTIARALIRNPRILILDEATSALDAGSEALFIRNLKRASRGRTIVMISHRMAPVTIADQVVFVMNGRIERVGPQTEVIEYARKRMAEHAGDNSL